MLLGGGLALAALALSSRSQAAPAKPAPTPPRGGGGGGGGGGVAPELPAIDEDDPGNVEPPGTTGDPEADVEVLAQEFILTRDQQATILESLQAWMHCSPSDYPYGFDTLRDSLTDADNINFELDLGGDEAAAGFTSMIDWFTGFTANRCLLDDGDFWDYVANPVGWSEAAQAAYERAMASSSAGEIATILTTYPFPESRRKAVSERYARIYGSAVGSMCSRLKAAQRGDTGTLNEAHALINHAARGLVPALDQQLGECIAANAPRILQ